jgi:hypothetical protein
LLAEILMLGKRPRCCLTATPASVTGPRACRARGEGRQFEVVCLVRLAGGQCEGCLPGDLAAQHS